jgi:hypothetical protein
VAHHARTGPVEAGPVMGFGSGWTGRIALACAVIAVVGAGSAMRRWGPAADAAAASRGRGSVVAVGAGTDARVAGSVPDVAWLAERGDGAWLHGRGATTAPDVLPAGETGLAAAERYLASTQPAPEGGSTLRLRDPGSAGLVASVVVPIWVSAGAWTGAGLVVTGYRDASMAADGGLLLVTVPDLEVRTLVEPGAFPEALGTPVARGEVVVSPSGRIVASNACGLRLCDTQVVDLQTGEIHRPLRSEEGFLRVVTDDLIVTTNDDYDWISARRFRDGGEAWRKRDSMLLDPLAAADGSVVGIVGSRATGWGLAAFDPRGRSRDLTLRTGTDQPWPRIWRQLSTSRTAVVGREGFEDAIRTREVGAATIVSVASSPPAGVLPDPLASASPEADR